MESRLDALENKPKLSVEDLDVRINKIGKYLDEHVESALTLKKVKAVVDDSIEQQQDQMKRLRTKLNLIEE